MKIGRWTMTVTLMAVSAGLFAQTATAQAGNPDGERSQKKAAQKTSSSTADWQARDDAKKAQDEAELLESSREAGLLTDWHLLGHFGRGGEAEFARKYAPEVLASKQAGKSAGKELERTRYELVFPGGTFALPAELARLRGVFYANSTTYLTGGGEWNVYMESGAAAVVFVDGRRVLTRGSNATGVQRGKIHLESGYHAVMVKFMAQAAPFRVAILPLNSGSRRKNNTPYLKASPSSEDMTARATGGGREANAE